MRGRKTRQNDNLPRARPRSFSFRQNGTRESGCGRMIEDDLASSGAEGLGDPLAKALATRGDAALAADSREYLREQTRLARLQSENLVDQNAFEMSHLRWRRFADRVRGTGNAILVMLVVLLIVA